MAIRSRRKCLPILTRWLCLIKSRQRKWSSGPPSPLGELSNEDGDAIELFDHHSNCSNFSLGARPGFLWLLSLWFRTLPQLQENMMNILQPQGQRYSRKVLFPKLYNAAALPYDRIPEQKNQSNAWPNEVMLRHPDDPDLLRDFRGLPESSLPEILFYDKIGIV